MPEINQLDFESIIRSDEIRRACAVINCVHEAMRVIPTLNLTGLTAVANEFKRVANHRTGPRGKLKRAWQEYVEQAISDFVRRDRQDYLSLYDPDRP